MAGFRAFVVSVIMAGVVASGFGVETGVYDSYSNLEKRLRRLKEYAALVLEEHQGNPVDGLVEAINSLELDDSVMALPPMVLDGALSALSTQIDYYTVELLKHRPREVRIGVAYDRKDANEYERFISAVSEADLLLERYGINLVVGQEIDTNIPPYFRES